MPLIDALRAATPAGYPRHALHADDRIWVEKNCYIDVWIEAIHALGCEPLAMLPFTVAIDFEGDQWTFYKPPHIELKELYGLDVQELNVWRPLLEHCEEHLAAGKLVSTEADAFWLPDTSGTDYRRLHTKSTIIVSAVDRERQIAHYFHNAGFFELSGEDFRQTFRVGFAPDPAFMPLFAEVIRSDRLQQRSEHELASVSAAYWRRHLQEVPRTNPVLRFRDRFVADLPEMQRRGVDYYHAWAFACTRQLGSAFELAGVNLQWLARIVDRPGLDQVATHFLSISLECKSLILKMARLVATKRTPDLEVFSRLADQWQQAVEGASAALASG